MAILFDESDDYFSIADDASLTLPDGDWCVGIWTRVTDNSSDLYQYIISTNGYSANNSFNMYIGEEGSYYDGMWFVIAEDANGKETGALNGATDYANGQWNLVIGQRNTSLSRIAIWVCPFGGVPVMEESVADTDFVQFDGGEWNIGRRRVSSIDRWYGSEACELFKGNFALTQDEITALGSGLSILNLGKDLDVYLPMRTSEETLKDLVGDNNATRVSVPTTSAHPQVYQRSSGIYVPVGTTGTETSSDRNAHITGQVSTESDRNAHIAGQVTTTSDRGARITGKVTTNSDRNSHITGKQSTTSDRNSKIKGGIISTSDRNSRIHGQSSEVSNRNAHITGKVSDQSDRNAKIQGQITVNSDRNARIRGGIISTSDRNSKIHGQVSITSDRNSHITGKILTNSDRNAKVHGQVTVNSDRNAVIRGQVSTNSDRNTKITGGIISVSNRNARIHGQSSENSDRNAKTTGTVSSISNRNAKIHGIDTVSSDRNAVIRGGLIVNSDRNSKITGKVITQSDRNSKISGSSSINSDRNSVITGKVLDTSDRNAKITGEVSITSDRNGKIKGKQQTYSDRNSKISGQTSANSDRNSIIKGSESTQSDRNARISGGLISNSDRNAKIEGTTIPYSDRNAKIHGIDSIFSGRNSKIRGSLEDTSDRNAKTTGGVREISDRNSIIHGIDTINSSRNAIIKGGIEEYSDRNSHITGGLRETSDRNGKIHGSDTDESDRDAKTHGIATIDSTRNAYLRGGLIVEDDRNAKTHGQITVENDRNGKIHGKAYAHSDRRCYIKGYIPPFVAKSELKRKIFQFGDQLKDLFLFTPFEEEDDWDDSIETMNYSASQYDGAYSENLNQSKKAVKNITKRFVLYSKEILEARNKTSQGLCSHDAVCTYNEATYRKAFIDYLYRGLRGGVKRLYAIMEDGTIRYTYAEVITIPYARSFSDPSKWIPFTIDFIIHDPYWYEVNDGYTFLYQDIPLLDIICGCASMSEAQAINYTSIIGYDHTQCIQNCSYDGVIIRNTDIAIPSEAEEWAELGASHTANGETTIQTCVEGSAGATRPKISFRNAFTNPKLTNLENDCEISYNGSIANGEYLEIDLNSSLSGEIDDLTINTNIGGFDRNDLTINNNGFFDLEKAINNLKVEGGTAVNSTFTIKFKNKYHN